MENEETSIKTAEAEYIKSRWSAMDKEPPPKNQRAGIALSGGGIRSATVSLGILTALSRLKIIRKFDYLSTVSGGGYTGAFYNSLIVSAKNWPNNGQPDNLSLASSDDPLGTPEGKMARKHLRDNGRYLLSRSSGNIAQIIVTAIRGWLAIQLVIGVSLLAFFLTLKALQALLSQWQPIQNIEYWLAANDWSSLLWPREWLQGYPASETLILSPLWPVSIIMYTFAAAFCGGYWLTPFRDPSEKPNIPPLSILHSNLVTMLGAMFVLVATCVYWQLTPYAIRPLRVVQFTVIAITGGSILAVMYVMITGVLKDLSSSKKKRQQSSAQHFRFIPKPPPELQKGETQSDLKTTIDSQSIAEIDVRFRNIITKKAAKWTTIATVTAMLAVVDTISQTIYTTYLQDYRDGVGLSLAAASIIAALTPFVRRLVIWAQNKASVADLARRFGKAMAFVAAWAALLVIVTFWATIAEYLSWQGAPIGTVRASSHGYGMGLALLWMNAGAFCIAAIFIGRSTQFLNLSTFSTFYIGRLRRAWLGASNPLRYISKTDTKSKNTSGIRQTTLVDKDIYSDDIAIRDYYQLATGAPLHLINITVNQTCGHGSTLVQRDRKGQPMTISAAGYLYSDDNGPQKRMSFARTNLPLSSWVGISGAAFSTGLGRNTSLGTSLLAGIANLRLGQWWTRPEDPDQPDEGKKEILRCLKATLRWLLQTQYYLFSEFFARFHGVHGKHWYLTDGGHFENTAIYELVRRRVPLIVAADNGADADYTFADVANLMRKLRIDFDAELEFLDCNKLDLLLGKNTPARGAFGTLDELARPPDSAQLGPYGAIARIHIPPVPPISGEPGIAEFFGTLILIKPRIAGLESSDLIDYKRSHPDFPQQSTGDQFFDEAQWESYFHLGKTMAETLFQTPLKGQDDADKAPADDNGEEKGEEKGDMGQNTTKADPYWSPADLVPIDPNAFPWFREQWPGTNATESRENTQLSRAAADFSTAVLKQPSLLDKIGPGKIIVGLAATIAVASVGSGIGQSMVSATSDTVSALSE